MARSETVLQVFLASPCDVQDEREIIESVIIELNRTWSKTLGIRLDLLRWETDTHPAIGSDAQAVINSQIEDEYDVFIGILWGRLGTPTPRAESGTLEEFERAHSRWKTNPSEVEIMLYFKDAPIRPSMSDGVQSDKVQAFKRSLGAEGVYHWTFDGPENFESLIRAHLSSIAQRWGKKRNPHPALVNTEALELDAHGLTPETSDSDDDLGYLDYLDRYNLSMDQMNSGIHAVGDATISIAEQIGRRTAEIEEIGSINDAASYKDARRTIKASADDMNRYADILGGQLPLLTTARREAFESLSKALALSGDFDSDDGTEVDDLDDSLRVMIDAASDALMSTAGFRKSIHGLPRLTSDLNKAKRRVVTALDLFISEVEATISTAKNLLKTLPEEQ